MKTELLFTENQYSLSWDQNDFINNSKEYIQRLNNQGTINIKDDILSVSIFYEISKGGAVYAKLCPKDFFKIITEKGINEIFKMQDLETRKVLFKKAVSDLKIFKGIGLKKAGKEFEYLFDIADSVKELKERIKNHELAIKVASLTKPLNLPKYCITNTQIVELYNVLLANNIFKQQIDITDFVRCFDLNNIPQNKPEYEHQNTMVYALSLVKSQNGKDAINQKNALANFGIKNYDAIKSNVKIKYPIDVLLSRKIKKALNIGEIN
jgi:hypothetical protein